MKLSTLNYIHDLLKEDVKAKTNARSLLFDAAVKAEKEYLDSQTEENKTRWDTVENQYRQMAELLWKAEEVLADFEHKEW